jgi:hypothetical protein
LEEDIKIYVVKNMGDSFTNDLLGKNDIMELKNQIEKRLNAFDGIPYELKEKFYRGCMKHEKGERMVKEVALELIRNKKWDLYKREINNE